MSSLGLIQVVMKEPLQLVDTLLSGGEIKKAEVAIAKLLHSDLSPHEQSQILLYRARIRLLSARPEDALEDLLNLSPEDSALPSTVELRGDCYFARFELASVGFAERSDIIQAEQYYLEIIRDHPDYNNMGWVYYQLGRIYGTTDQLDRATDYFQQALLNPTHVKPLTSYCYERLGFIAYYDQRELEKAISFLDRAVNTYPASENPHWLVEVHLLRSRVFRGMRDYEQAWNATQAALAVVIKENAEYKSALAEVQLMAGEVLSEIGKRDKEVINYLQQFIQHSKKPLGIDVTWSRVNEMLGDAYFNLGHYDNAISAYQTALQLNPDHPWGLSLQYRIARSYYQQKDYTHVITTIERLLKVAEDEEQTIDDYHIYDTLGNAFFALRKYNEAINAYRLALQTAPPNADSVDKIKSYHDLARELI
jgi:tetratricopeptide (TPR) repeat protein